MPRTLDENFVLDGFGNLAILDDLESLRQKVVRKLQHFQGEWFLDTKSGVPYFQTIFDRPITVGLVESILTREIREEPEVIQVQNVASSLDAATRGFTYQAQVESIHGAFNVEV